MKITLLCVAALALFARSAVACGKANDCQTDGDMSAYCKDNNDCHCSAPHFLNADGTCKLACSPGDSKNACCRDDSDCQEHGDKDAYCKSLRGYNPGNGMCRCGDGFSGSTTCKKTGLQMEVSAVEPVVSAVSEQLGLCSPCIQFSEQGLNVLLNEILNAGVIGGCNKLCSALKQKASKTACNLLCDVVGIKAFIKALNHTDLDPIYFCEKLGACPKGNPNAQAKIVNVEVSPTSGASGTKFQMQVQFQVTNATGVSEIRIAVDGPTTNPVSQGFIQQGFANGQFAANVSLDTTSDPFPSDPSKPPVMWNPGTYNYTFELCQGECGSKHPGSIDFGKKSGTFEITQ